MSQEMRFDSYCVCTEAHADMSSGATGIHFGPILHLHFTRIRGTNTNSYKTSGRQLKQSNQPFLPQQYDYEGDDQTSPCLVEEETQNTDSHNKTCLKGHSKIDKTKIIMTNGSLMQVKSSGAFCNTFVIHSAIIGLEPNFRSF